MIRVLCLIATEDRLFNMRCAARNVQRQYPGLLEARCHSVWDLAAHPERSEALLKDAQDCHFGMVYFHGGIQCVSDFPQLWEKLRAIMPIWFQSSIPEEAADFMARSGLSPEDYRTLSAYFHLGGEENLTQMLLQIAARHFGADCAALPPVAPAEEGFYLDGEILSQEQTEELRRLAASHTAPVVGLILQYHQIINRNTRHIDAMIHKLQELGAHVLPLFSRMANNEDEQMGVCHAMERYFTWEGEKLPQVILVMAGFSVTHMSHPGDGSETGPEESVFAQWGVPALQVMATRYSPEDYQQGIKGMDPMSLTSSIFQPELDGQIITIPCAAQMVMEEDGIARKVYLPLPDRVDRACRLALNWAKLGFLPAKEKKVAILFNTMHGGDTLGCAEGLDTFESVYRMVRALQDQGISTEYDFTDGQDIAQRLTAGLTNDIRWISEEEMVRRAAAVIPPEIWKPWFADQAPKVRRELEERWGKAPGEVMVQDDQLLLPGLINGNVFIGLQPSRAFGDQAEAVCHSTDSTPPYSYLACYRYLEEVFGANVICHIGTHGTVEWLPGKEVGLSGECYPDICMGNLPHLYPYHMGITGEGIEAKRRSRAVILDHLPPALDEADAYEELAVIDDALKEYYQAVRLAPAQVPGIAERIFTLAEQAGLTGDLHMSHQDLEKDPEGTIQRIHLWVGELKQTVIKDGLHIFGEAPQGKCYENFLRMLVRVQNGRIPSLGDAILLALGQDPETVREHPADQFGEENGVMLLDRATEIGRRLIAFLSERDYAPSAVEEAIGAEHFPGSTAALRETLAFVCGTVCDKLNRTTEEMTHYLDGINGRFVPPALGGNPTRGNVDMLPTGRNFYAGDPAQIPSRGAYAIGQRLAQQALETYAQQESGYPESMAMVVWAGNTLKTGGEDFAECLYMMGARPVYLGESSRVVGVEPIPLAELGRPRLDITLRISGLFRDMYPNLIQLMDQAVTCIAALDEPEEQNYLRKHVLEDMRQLTQEGLPQEEARDRACARIYGCAPGCYGAGVPALIESRQWSDFHDLARAYETWGSYAYTAQSHGEQRREMFRRRMSTVSVTIKNESTVEYDMLSSDDFYGYHGGLVACVRSNSGKKPLAVTGHSDDPSHPVTRELGLETARTVRGRILNPKWLEGLKRHGYKGAQEVALLVDRIFGWDASADVGEDWMYQTAAEKFLFDEETRAWMEEVNRWAVHSISEKLLEAEKRGMWNTDQDTLRRLQMIYMQAEGSIEDVSC